MSTFRIIALKVLDDCRRKGDVKPKTIHRVHKH